MCIQIICVGGNSGSSPSWLSKSVWWSCLFHCQKKEWRGPSVTSDPAIPCACSCCTYITCTTTPMPDTASLSTAFSIAWEMVSNKSSGSCWETLTVYRCRADCDMSGLGLSWLWQRLFPSFDFKTYHVWFPQRFTHAVHLLWTGAAHDKVFRLHGAANQI